MAAISIDATLVRMSSSGQPFTLVAAVSITAGQALFITAANLLDLADANGTTPANSFSGFARNSAAAGQPVDCTGLDPGYIFGGTVNAGDDIWLSPTPGGITKTRADLITGCTVIHLGCALGATGATNVTTMNLKPCVGGVV